MSAKIVGIRGMNDLLPENTRIWSAIEAKARELFELYGYEEIRTPIVENSSLFTRGLGEVTDIVEKEMYSFTDKLNGQPLTLRPENTASVIRAVIEHNLIYNEPKKYWYFGPMFRHERPQKGRYRQFYQFGVEGIGYSGIEVEAEQIFMTKRFWNLLGLQKDKSPSLSLNCIGSKNEREKFKDCLVIFLNDNKDKLDEDSIRRLSRNPLRILDSKNSVTQEVLSQGPRIGDFLKVETLENFSQLCKLLDDKEIKYSINERLVRGLDYYNGIVFEWLSPLLGAQDAICGGGRYDSLMQSLGGKQADACGFALGMERIVNLVEEIGDIDYSRRLDVYLVNKGDEARRIAVLLAEQWRDVGISVKIDMTNVSLKAQMKRAAGSFARFVAVLTDLEVRDKCVNIRPLQKESVLTDKRKDRLESQQSVPLKKAGDYLLKCLMNEDVKS